MKDRLSHPGTINRFCFFVYTALFCTGAVVGAERAADIVIAADVSDRVYFAHFTGVFSCVFLQHIALVVAFVILATHTFGWLCINVTVFLAGLWHASGFAVLLAVSDQQVFPVAGLLISYIMRSAGLTAAILAAVECTVISYVSFSRVYKTPCCEKMMYLKKRYLRIIIYSVFLTAAAAAEAAVSAFVFHLMR